VTHHHTPNLTPGELAEAEASSDVTEAAPGAAARLHRPDEQPVRPSATETELAFAETESDLSHSEPAR
jgi:hypothetical protein